MGSVSQDYLPLKSPMASGESPAYPQFLSCSATHQRFPRLPPRVQSFARAAHRVQESRVPAGLLLLSRSVVSSPSATPWTVAPRPRSMALPRQEHWAGCRSLLQGILLTRGLHPRLLPRQADSLRSAPGKPLTKSPVHSKRPMEEVMGGSGEGPWGGERPCFLWTSHPSRTSMCLSTQKQSAPRSSEMSVKVSLHRRA